MLLLRVPGRAWAKAPERIVQPVQQPARLIKPGHGLAEQAVAPRGVAASRRFTQKVGRMVPQALRVVGAVAVAHAGAAVAITAKA